MRKRYIKPTINGLGIESDEYLMLPASGGYSTTEVLGRRTAGYDLEDDDRDASENLWGLSSEEW